jgi:hypothetical protein
LSQLTVVANGKIHQVLYPVQITLDLENKTKQML